MATKKKGTLAKVGESVKKATKSVAKTAEEYVVKPVSKALGTKGKKKTTKKPAAKSTSTTRKTAAKKTTAKKSTARKK